MFFCLLYLFIVFVYFCVLTTKLRNTLERFDKLESTHIHTQKPTYL